MKPPGIVTSLTGFRLLVDIGIHQDGLVQSLRFGLQGQESIDDLQSKIPISELRHALCSMPAGRRFAMSGSIDIRRKTA